VVSHLPVKEASIDPESCPGDDYLWLYFSVQRPSKKEGSKEPNARVET